MWLNGGIMKLLSSYDRRIATYQQQVIADLGIGCSCIYCHSTQNLVRDVCNSDIYYCMECLSKSLLHDERIIEGSEAEPDVI